MKVKGDKSHLLMSGNEATANIDNNRIESEDIREVHGTTIDSKLTFKTQINKLCKKVRQKLNALPRISSYMTFAKRKTITKAFITSQFSYCPLVWMLHSKRLVKQIHALHEGALRVTHGDKTSSSNKLLEKNNSASIHYKNLQALAT